MTRQPRWKKPVLALAAGFLTLVTAVPSDASPAFSVTTSNPGNSLAAAATFPDYPTTVTGDSPTVYYRADDTAGNTFPADSSGHGSTGMLAYAQDYQVTGGPSGGSTTKDTALYLSGNGNAGCYLTTAITAPNTFTVEAWFRTRTTDGGEIADFGDTSTGDSGNYDRAIYMGNDGKLHAGVYFNFALHYVDSTASYNDGNWHQVALTVGASGMTLYVDGASVATDATATGGQSMTGYWRLGGDKLLGWNNAPNSWWFLGVIDDVGIYSTALSAARISAHYSNALTATSQSTYTTNYLTPDSPWALWRLDDAAPAGAGTTTTAADASGNGRTATYYGMGNTPNVTSGNSGALVGSQAAHTAWHFGGTGWGFDPVLTTGPTTFSLELWFRTSTSTGGRLLGFGNRTATSSGSYDRQIWMANTGVLYFGAGSTINTTTAYNDGNWHHVIATFGATYGERIYVDGTLMGSNASPGSAQSYSGYWRWGGDSLGGWSPGPTTSNITADIDELAVYPTELSPQQVMWHYYANH